MPELRGLPDTSGPLDAVIVRTVGEARRRLRERLPSVTAAGPEGALNLWHGDSGAWHGNVNRYGTVIEQADFASREGGLRWFGENLPELGDFDQMASLTGSERGPWA